jgi:hypothetical protein
MKLTPRKAAVGLALTGSIIGVGATSASALECHNVSRAAPPQPSHRLAVLPQTPTASFTVWVVQGDWWFINLQPNVSDFSTAVWDKVPPGTWTNILHAPPGVAAALGLPAGTVNGNFQAGQGVGLLDHSQAPCNANRQTQHGIQADCSPPTIP